MPEGKKESVERERLKIQEIIEGTKSLDGIEETGSRIFMKVLVLEKRNKISSLKIEGRYNEYGCRQLGAESIFAL